MELMLLSVILAGMMQRLNWFAILWDSANLSIVCSVKYYDRLKILNYYDPIL